jgi:hypothetical protein
VTADERLAAIRVKVDRARRHIDELHAAVGKFLDARPYEVVAKDGSKTEESGYFVSRVSPVPPTISAITGDILQNLRSGLDHLAYQLVEVGLGAAPTKPREIAYPIADSAAAYPLLRDGRVKGARPDAIKAIDATKPYKGGDDALWRLHHLNNIDKHRLLLTVGSALRSVDFEPITRLITGFAKSAPLYIKPADRKFPLKVGDRLYAGIYEGMSFRFDVALGEPQIVEGESLLETVQHMADAVDGLIGGFKPLLV